MRRQFEAEHVRCRILWQRCKQELDAPQSQTSTGHDSFEKKLSAQFPWLTSVSKTIFPYWSSYISQLVGLQLFSHSCEARQDSYSRDSDPSHPLLQDDLVSQNHLSPSIHHEAQLLDQRKVCPPTNTVGVVLDRKLTNAAVEAYVALN